MTTKVETTKTKGADFDAVVIGAGFGGLYAVHKLRNEQGLNVCAIDNASDVGGTWYWNRYPGALSDTESYICHMVQISQDLGLGDIAMGPVPFLQQVFVKDRKSVV